MTRLMTLWPFLLLCQCSLAYGEPPIGQCSSDIDCQEQLGANEYSCDLGYRICVPLRSSPSEAMQVNSPEPAIEDTPSLEVSSCPPAGMADLASDTVGIGMIVPRTFGLARGEVFRNEYATRLVRAAELARDEWSEVVTSATLATPKDSLTLLHCDSKDDLATARLALAYLDDSLHTPLVLTFTDRDTDAIRFQAARLNVPVLCATCLDVVDSSLDANEFLWHLSPPLSDQGVLAAWRVGELAAQVRQQQQLPASNLLRVVVLSEQLRGIPPFIRVVEDHLDAMGGFSRRAVDVGEIRTRVPPQRNIAEEVIANRPAIVVVAMGEAFSTFHLRQIEQGWPSDTPPPYYVMTHLNQEPSLFSDFVRTDDLRKRMSGTGWSLALDARLNLGTLEERYQRSYRERLGGAQNAYDAFYAAAYALEIAKRLSGNDLTAASISGGLGLLSSGPTTQVGPAALRSTLAFSPMGQGLNLIGTSAALNWRSERHQPSSDVGLWCFTQNDSGELSISSNAGPKWIHTTGEILGEYNCQ